MNSKSQRLRHARRIVSFLPSATEMVCALGLGDRLVGITHECDYPPDVRGKPVVVHSAIAIGRLSQAGIDEAVTACMRDGRSVYTVDEDLLRRLDPDLILTQDLCQVCAPSGNEVTRVLQALPTPPQVLWLTPRNLEEIADNIREIGRAVGCQDTAEKWTTRHFARVKNVLEQAAQRSSTPRVFCMEWLDPVYCCGHWVPQMVRIAGGSDELGREGRDSVRIAWKDVIEWSPEIIVLMPCGYHLEKVLEYSHPVQAYPYWSELPAVRKGQVYAVDASSYFARPGPRVVEGTELLAHLIHPEIFPWHGPRTAFKRLV